MTTSSFGKCAHCKAEIKTPAQLGRYIEEKVLCSDCNKVFRVMNAIHQQSVKEFLGDLQ